jgi:hypothetical protein
MKELLIMEQDTAYDQYVINQCEALNEASHHEHDCQEHHAQGDADNVVHVNFAQVAANAPTLQSPTLPGISLTGTVNTKKRVHSDLIMEGVCQRCAHCGMELTDSVSVERGIGPTCSKKGYLEDPKDGDEMQAMIDLAEYPELVDLLTKNYKPLGVRGLMNGLVKVASLNRKHEVFSACCDAIDSLGYGRLAALLRDSIAAISVYENDKYPDYLVVWVKKAYWNYTWMRELYNIPGTRTKIHGIRGVLILKTQKQNLWAAMKRVYEGYVVKTNKGAFKIKSGPKQVVKV